MTWIIRPFGAGDVRSVASFLRAVHAQDDRVDPFEDAAFEALVGQWAGGRDFLVATERDAITGVAMSYRYAVSDRPHPVRSFHVVVAPDARRRGVGTSLLDHIEAQDSVPVAYRTVLPGGSPDGASLLARRGYVEVQTTLLMRRGRLAPPPPAATDGYRIREPRLPDEAHALAAVYNDAYAGAFGFSPLDAEDVRLGDGGRLVVLDDPDGAPAGWVHTLPGVLQTVQVTPGHQRRGLGRALTVAALNVLAQQGYAEVELTVDAVNTAAVQLYESLDFAAQRRDLTLERTV